jgi:hypothetical protein
MRVPILGRCDRAASHVVSFRNSREALQDLSSQFELSIGLRTNLLRKAVGFETCNLVLLDEYGR